MEDLGKYFVNMIISEGLWEVSQFVGDGAVMVGVRQLGEVRVRIHEVRGLVDPRAGEQRRDLRGLLQRHDVLLVLGRRLHQGALPRLLLGRRACTRNIFIVNGKILLKRCRAAEKSDCNVCNIMISPSELL